jgi:hypothetical protein
MLAADLWTLLCFVKHNRPTFGAPLDRKPSRLLLIAVASVAIASSPVTELLR